MSIECPECGGVCEGAQCDRCDFPLELVGRVSRAADRLSRTAARSLADGRPQKACELAEESLRLRTKDNDLAAFVVIVARCAGAAVSLLSIPSPRADRLPESLRSHLHAVLTEIRSPETGGLSVIPEQRDLGDRRFGMPALAVAVVVFALVSGYIFGSWGDGSREPPTARRETPPSTGGPGPGAPNGTPDEPDPPTDEDRELVSRVVKENWIDTLLVARAAYQRGRSRSRRGLYDSAATDFGVARQFGDGAYFYDDAVYFQARALQRSGSLCKAQEAYEHLLSLSTDEGLPYRADAKRFLGQLRNHCSEEQVAR